MKKFFKFYNFIISNLLVASYFLNKKNIKLENIRFEVVVFSFNRALQLESLIESLISNLDKKIKINILYKTDKNTIDLYNKLKKRFKNSNNIIFIHQENSFKISLIKLTKYLNKEKQNNKQILFFVDDQILFKKVKLYALIDLLNYAPIITLRLGLNTKKSFNLNKKQNIRNYPYSIKNNSLSWKPLFKNDDISYVFSFDSSTIPLKLFNRFSRYLLYKGPNTLESSINYGSFIYKLVGHKIASFLKQHAINLVITKVQNETSNRGDFIDSRELDDLFIKNWKLKIKPTELENFDSPHTDTGYLFEKENI